MDGVVSGCPTVALHGSALAGTLDAEQQAALDEHVARCERCAELRRSLALGSLPTAPAAAPAATEPTARARGSQVGRYAIVDVLGKGGMGVVYTAYDPELHRKVALKMLHPVDDDGNGRARFLREAQAMARLSHPNVVPIFDVGTAGDEIFIAMELVDGQNLRAWLAEEPRTPAEVLRCLVDAGRGLSAAHAAGLVHRDFKPDNVLVGKDGRARVTDFGLARGDGVGAAAPTGVASSEPVLDAELTHDGAFLGTPAYMAPEQLDGRRVDTRSDQFNFCVAAFEALHGVRPFEGKTIIAIRDAIANGRIRSPSSTVDARITDAIRRGLAADPAQRHASLDDLLAAMSPPPPRRKRRPWRVIVPVAAIAAAGGGVVALRASTSSSEACVGDADRIDAVWGPARKAALHAAFARVAPDAADTILGQLATPLDRVTGKWRAQAIETCSQPEPLRTAHQRCLEDRMLEIDQLADVLATGDATALRSATAALYHMRKISTCTNQALLLDEFGARTAPDSPELHAARAEVARARFLAALGRKADARKLGTHAVAEARRLGDRPLVAQGLLDLVGTLKAPAEIEAALRDATSAADASGADIIRAGAWMMYYKVVSKTDRLHDAETMLPIVQSAVARVRDGNPEMEAELEMAIGQALYLHNRSEEAIPHTQRAIAIREQLPDKQIPIGFAYRELAKQLGDAGRTDEEVEAARKAMADDEKHLAPRHKEMADSLSIVSDALVDAYHYDEALAALQRALSIYEEVDPDSEDVRITAESLATVQHARGELDEAEKYARRAVAPFETHVDDDQKSTAATAWLALASIEDDRNQPRQAADAIARSLAICDGQTADQRDARNCAAALITAGAIALHAGDAKRARDLVERGQAEQSRTLPASHPAQLAPLWTLAAIARAQANSHDAIALCEQAEAVESRLAPADPVRRARAQFELAQSLWLDPPQRARARSLATEARAPFAERAMAVRVANVDAWLASHAP